jgi:hypothetical protein
VYDRGEVVDEGEETEMKVREARIVLSAAACALVACASSAKNEASSDSGTSSVDAGVDSSRKGPIVVVSVGGGADASLPCDGGVVRKPAEVTRVSGWLSDTSSGLPAYAYTNIDTYFPTGTTSADPTTGTYPRTDLVDAIVGACSAFAPRLTGWQEYCEAILTSEIVSESSYEPGTPTPGPPSSTSVSYDSYGTMDGHNDPTVGLLQVRFSSIVQSYQLYGPIPTIEAIGCSWPSVFASEPQGSSFWTSEGGTVTYLTFMENPLCNIPLAAWAIFQNATGNGGAQPIYTAAYCAGQGEAANVVDGLLSYLEGPGFTRGSPDAEAENSYPAGIKARFIPLVGGTLPSPDPFEVTLSPDTCVYCN